MKFSYSWIKDYVSSLPQKKDVVESLNLYSFETESIKGDGIDVSLQPNRYCDASGHIGIAREVAASNRLKFSVKRPRRIKKLTSGWFSIFNQDKEACPYYCALFVDEVSVKQSPAWLKKRLETCGIRPINNVVDVMNYVMLEYGQPLHAFDADKIGMGVQGKKVSKKDIKNKIGIYIRRAKKGEKITTLDNQDLILTEDVLLIADNVGPLAIAGIKGGKRAEVDKSTKKIIIESALFDAVTTFKVGNNLMLKTDAFDRFSRGMSSIYSLEAAQRACELLIQIKGAKEGIGYVSSGKQTSQLTVLDIHFNWLHSFLGVRIPSGAINSILLSLGFSIKERSKNKIRVNSPSSRIDIQNKEDVAEEIARIFGYNNLNSVAPVISVSHANDQNDVLGDKIRNILISLGFHETYNYSFVSKKDGRILERKTPVELLNPISDNLTHLRTTLFSGLLKNVADNFRYFSDAKLFEIGASFEVNNAKKGNYGETMSIGIIHSRKKAQSRELFYEIKGTAEQLMQKLGITDYSFARHDDVPANLIPGQCAKVVSENVEIGSLGVSSEMVGSNYAAYAEFNYYSLLKLIRDEHEFEAISKHPSVERDISIIVENIVRVADVQSVVYAAGVRYIDDVDLLDMYEGKDFGESKKNIVFRVVFQAEDKTLSDDEVNMEMSAIINALERELDAQIR